MWFYADQIVPRFIDLAMRRDELTPIRARVAASLEGNVLEVGFGSGLKSASDPSDLRQPGRFDRASNLVRIGSGLTAAILQQSLRLNAAHNSS